MLRAKWLPRLQNEEADALTNLDFRHFDPAKRIPVELNSMRFGVLDALFKHGEEYITELEAAKAAEKERAAKELQEGRAQGGGRKRKKASDSLRERDPW